MRVQLNEANGELHWRENEYVIGSKVRDTVALHAAGHRFGEEVAIQDSLRLKNNHASRAAEDKQPGMLVMVEGLTTRQTALNGQLCTLLTSHETKEKKIYWKVLCKFAPIVNDVKGIDPKVFLVFESKLRVLQGSRRRPNDSFKAGMQVYVNNAKEADLDQIFTLSENLDNGYWFGKSRTSEGFKLLHETDITPLHSTLDEKEAPKRFEGVPKQEEAVAEAVVETVLDEVVRGEKQLP